MIKRGRSHGFTIVELLIVIVVIGILATVTIIAYNGIQTRAVAAALSSDVTNAARQLKLFQIDNGTYPTTIDCGQADSATNKCVKTNPGTTYQYIVNNNNPQMFCIAAISGSNSYNIGNDSSPLGGNCPALRLDATNATSYPGSGTDWVDLSGNGNNGTLINGVGYSNTNGVSLSFDGVDDYIALPNDIITTANMRANGVTYSAWVRPTNFATSRRIVGQKPSSGYSDFASGGIGTNTSGKAQMIVYDDNIAYKYANGGTTLSSNTWHLIIGTYDSSDKNIKVYVNGSLDSAATPIVTFSRLLVNAENIIGSLRVMPAQSFLGSISDVRIYNKALTAAEINQIFNTQKGRYGI